MLQYNNNNLILQVYHTLGNVPKARAALTSARTTANSIYVPPKLQSALDMQSGILHGEEKDFKTAFSYFYEAFEGYDSVEHPFALDGLKYMLLCKIMLGAPDDVQALLTGKMGTSRILNIVTSWRGLWLMIANLVMCCVRANTAITVI